MNIEEIDELVKVHEFKKNLGFEAVQGYEKITRIGNNYMNGKRYTNSKKVYGFKKSDLKKVHGFGVNGSEKSMLI